MTKATGIRIQRLSGEAARTLVHGEAFALMKYQNKVTGRVEWIWNSRDGVTPFVIDDPLCSPERKAAYERRLQAGEVDIQKEPEPDKMAHADWGEDAFIPNFCPLPGTRIFMSWKDAPEAHKDRLRKAWHERIEAMLKENPGTERQAARAREEEPFGLRPDDPVLVVVTEELERHFHGLAATNPYRPAPQSGIITPTRPGLVPCNT